VWIAVLGSVKLFPNLEAALKGVFNRVLTELRLNGNEIGDVGAKAIAEALKVALAQVRGCQLGCKLRFGG